MLCRLVFGEGRAVFVPRALLFESARREVVRRGDRTRALWTLRAGRGFRTADFFAELFFLVGLAMGYKRLLIAWRRKNGRLIKNISLSAQADSVKKFRLVSICL